MSITLKTLTVAIMTVVGVAGPARAGDVEIDWQDDRLSVQADAMPIVDLLEKIGEAVGAEIKAEGALGSTGVIRIRHARLDTALARIVGNRGFMIHYSVGDDGKPAPELVTVYNIAPSSERVVASRDGGTGSLAGVDAEDERDRWRAIRKLSRGGTIDDLPVLLAAIADESPLVRAEAARGVMAIDPDEGAEILRSAVETEEDRKVRVIMESLLDDHFGRVGS